MPHTLNQYIIYENKSKYVMQCCSKDIYLVLCIIIFCFLADIKKKILKKILKVFLKCQHTTVFYFIFYCLN